jgi:catalase
MQFQPGHIVRGIDFTEDPLLQGRIFSYLDTQLNRNGGPNFEQLPINRPVIPIHNNNRDGAGQTFIHKNTAACKYYLPAYCLTFETTPRYTHTRTSQYYLTLTHL